MVVALLTVTVPQITRMAAVYWTPSHRLATAAAQQSIIACHHISRSNRSMLRRRRIYCSIIRNHRTRRVAIAHTKTTIVPVRSCYTSIVTTCVRVRRPVRLPRTTCRRMPSIRAIYDAPLRRTLCRASAAVHPARVIAVGRARAICCGRRVNGAVARREWAAAFRIVDCRVVVGPVWVRVAAAAVDGVRVWHFKALHLAMQ